MKNTLTTLLLIVLFNNISKAQCINSSSFNGSLNFSSTVTSIPNDMAPTGWSKVSTPDQAKAGINIDCTSLPLVASLNGGSWTRMADKVSIQEAIYRDISGFIAGTYYEFTFEQGLVKNWGRSSGNINVTMGATTIGSPVIALPYSSTGQTGWQTVTVGPFLATSSTMTVTFAAHSNLDGTGSSPMPGSCNGYTQNALAADLMIDGISVCPILSLPLNFLSFELTKDNSIEILNWTIADPQNELGKFILTSSTDLITWNRIGTIAKKDNEENFSFPVELPSAENIYYKVTAYNAEGAALSSTKTILSNTTFLDEGCKWIYNSEKSELCTTPSARDRIVVIYNTKGDLIKEYTVSANTNLLINTQSFQEGLYILLSNNGEQNCSSKFIK